MAQCKQTPHDFIKNAFTPQIAVMCTPLAENCCQKNNLNFIELLQPFTKLSNDIHYKDPTGTVITVRNLKLTFLDVNSRPPQTTLARKFLNASVSDAGKSKSQMFASGDHKLEIPSSTPWFESWRDTFLRVQYPSDHEYTKHFLACVLVVSSSDNNPYETIVQLAQNLNQMQNNTPGKLPKWFSSNILKYYLIIHDTAEGNKETAAEAYDSVKKSYGENNCFLLRMNSKPVGSVNMEHPPDPWSQFINNQIEIKYKQTPESSPYPKHIDNRDLSDVGKNLSYHPLSPDTEELTMNGTVENEKFPNSSTGLKIHGLCLSTEDVEQVKSFVFEFCKSCLIPYIEKQIMQLNDVTSNKKGVSRSLFSATKRWFNPNKPGAGSVAVNNLIYAPDSPELQIRRLGDLYFMFGHYNSAFQAYHLAKRDYNTDQAWLYYAGALEMASLAAFMANDASRKTCDYMEESITTYLNTCKMPQFATRATLLSSECLKNRGMYGEAALQLIRMTSEESDLRSALFLEQASYCFLHSKMIRKYAFHMVLAGHRFSKAAQRKHSLRTYKQAYQIYENSGWDLAEDHIHYTIGRQAHNLHSFKEAVVSFAKLLNGTSKQSSLQQSIFLKEYLTILGNKLRNENSEDVPTLVLPQLDNKSLKLLVGPRPPLTRPGNVPAVGVNFSDDSKNEARWKKLEEILVQEAQDYLPPLFKPMITLYNSSNLNKTTPIAVVNEPIQLCIRLVNSLKIVLLMKDICLLWNSNNECNNDIKTHTVKSVLIQENSSQDLVLSVTPLKTGEINIDGICYTLFSTSNATDNIFIKGRQLFNQKLLLKILPSAPCLEVTFSELNLELCNEIQKVVVNLKNTGTVPLHNIKMATSVPHLLSNCDRKSENLPKYSSSLIPALKEKLIRDNHVTSVPLKNEKLEPGEAASIAIWVKAPERPGPYLVDLLIYYENIDLKSMPRYRLVRHYWNLVVQDSVKVELVSQQSYNTKNVEELDLVMKITNLNKIHSSIQTEINLLNVGMFSRYWSLTEDIITPKYVTLNSEESVHILLKAKRTNDEKNKYSIILLNKDGAIRQNFSHAYISFAEKTDKCKINIFNENEMNHFNNNGILLVQWQASVCDNNQKRLVNGQTQIPVEIKFDSEFDIDDISINSIIISDNREDEKKSQITYNLIYPAVVEHNFDMEKLCVIPVTLLLHSIVQDTILNVIINTLGTNSNTSQPSLFYPNASRNFLWLGMGNCTKILKPLSTESVQLSVVVSRPGTFDLGARLQVLCNTIESSDEAVVQLCHIQSALIVVNGNS